MTSREGTLHLQSDGRWVIIREDKQPYEITSGELFRVEVNGLMKPTRMEYAHGPGPGEGQYVSVHGYTLEEGLKASIGDRS